MGRSGPEGAALREGVRSPFARLCARLSVRRDVVGAVFARIRPTDGLGFEASDPEGAAAGTVPAPDSTSSSLDGLAISLLCLGFPGEAVGGDERAAGFVWDLLKLASS